MSQYGAGLVLSCAGSDVQVNTEKLARHGAFQEKTFVSVFFPPAGGLWQADEKVKRQSWPSADGYCTE